MLRPQRVRPLDIAHTIARGRRTLTTLATPCTCGRRGCSIGEHIYRATKDAQPDGQRAQAFDQGPTSGTKTAPTPSIDSHADGAHDQFRQQIALLATTLHQLDIIINNWRPDRDHSPDTSSDDDWCRHHLDTIGVCEPRYRGDMCRRCYEFALANRAGRRQIRPTVEILETWRRGRNPTIAMVDEARRTAKQNRKKGRKK